jgi:hypothetical protein
MVVREGDAALDAGEAVSAPKNPLAAAGTLLALMRVREDVAELGSAMLEFSAPRRRAQLNLLRLTARERDALRELLAERLAPPWWTRPCMCTQLAGQTCSTCKRFASVLRRVTG